eukprot:CAMPEP_0173300498 /NCGR_PEP_ID=MMETSP1143-20121109/17259_1 /TAXON_ID=483371 /ORGANISM="non described non described, Strain CCMP2298" /LENGTH=209 /DNA_ID=CAMNT_0014240887 /DNA_START=366 /DNA_END=996 /DNA_ORIENTATION=-
MLLGLVIVRTPTLRQPPNSLPPQILFALCLQLIDQPYRTPSAQATAQFAHSQSTSLATVRHAPPGRKTLSVILNLQARSRIPDLPAPPTLARSTLSRELIDSAAMRVFTSLNDTLLATARSTTPSPPWMGPEAAARCCWALSSIKRVVGRGAGSPLRAPTTAASSSPSPSSRTSPHQTKPAPALTCANPSLCLRPYGVCGGGSGEDSVS